MLDLLHQINKYRHARLLATAERKNSNCSRFTRNRVQLQTLIEGPVLDHVRMGNSGTIRIVVLGCSYGPEPVSIASLLLWKRPDVDFRIDAYDIDERSLEFARRAVYEHRHVFNHEDVDSEFVAHTFLKDETGYTVKNHIRDRVRYHYGDATDDRLADEVGPLDILFAQHFLYHLSRDEQILAFRRIAAMLPPHGVLFIDGMDVDLRHSEVRRLRLRPMRHKIREIHECSRRTPWARSWPYNYYGLEPLVESGDWEARYSTIFTPDAMAPGAGSA